MMTPSLAELSRRIVDDAEGSSRYLLGIAGPPGAGKSYRTEKLYHAIDAILPGEVVVVPMDGYHFDNDILRQKGWCSVKGAPKTFDANRLCFDLQLIRKADLEIAVPVFDRSLDLSRASACLVTGDHRIILVEGNYLLLKDEPWSRLHECFDMTVLIDTPEDILEKRLIERWLGYGFSLEDSRRRALGNDMPNARFVKQNSIAPTLLWR